MSTDAISYSIFERNAFGYTRNAKLHTIYTYKCNGRLLGIWYLNPAFPKTEILLDVDIADKQIKIYNIFTSFIPMHTYTYLFCCIRHCVYYDRVIEKQFSYHSQSNNKNMNMSFFYWTLTEISFWIQKLSLPQNIFRLICKE